MKRIKDPDYFVVGLQKSGSYWITALLDAHKDIRCLPSLYGGQTGVAEGRIFDMLFSIEEDGGKSFQNSFLNNHNGFFADLVSLLDKIDKDELYKKFRDRYSEWCHKHSSGKKIIGDKTVEYIFHLDLIDSFYPKAKKICILRNPKDRIVSFNFHQIRKGRKKDEKISDSFVYKYSERVMKEYKSMLNYGGYIHCLTYESLRSNTYYEIKRMLDYLGADTTKQVIEHMINEGSIEKCREKDKLISEGDKKMLIKEELRKSHYRKGIVGDWKNYLTNKQISAVDKILGELEKKVFNKYDIKINYEERL